MGNNKVPFSATVCAHAVKQLHFLDRLKAMGEDADEISSDVAAAAGDVSSVYFCWLNNRGIDEGSEVLAMMAGHFIEYLYLTFESRRSTLANFTKQQLSDFFNLCEFAVPERLWLAHINPFDGARLFFEFLSEYSYPIKLESRCRAVKQLRKNIKKSPIAENLTSGISAVQ